MLVFRHHHGPCPHELALVAAWVVMAGCPQPPSSARGSEPAPVAAHGRDPAPVIAADSEREDRLADLGSLCAALNEDYVDGTLSDSFAKVVVRTAWGREQQRLSSEADRPGRFLEARIEEFFPGAREPGLAACRELLGYLDEVE